MAHIFISYSSKDIESANAINYLLIKNGLQTWMAPNNIPAGRKYADVITKAIRECLCFVLLLTNDSQESDWVSKEVERAIHYKKVIVPIALENIELNDEFELYLSTNQIVSVKKISDSSDEFKKIIETLITISNQVPDNDKPCSELKLEKPEPSECVEIDALSDAPTEQWEQYNLGFEYEFAINRPVDHVKAVKWYQKSANQGNSWSQHRLGECYFYGKGVKCDYYAAFYWFKKAEEQGNQEVNLLLAECYEKGLGVEKNSELADFYRNKS